MVIHGLRVTKLHMMYMYFQSDNGTNKLDSVFKLNKLDNVTKLSDLRGKNRLHILLVHRTLHRTSTAAFLL
jgi:hypothetical protein